MTKCCQRNFQIIEFDAGAHYKGFITVFTLSYCFISKYCSTCDVVDCVDISDFSQMVMVQTTVDSRLLNMFAHQRIPFELNFSK
jgi:hypothetical protein